MGEAKRRKLAGEQNEIPTLADRVYRASYSGTFNRPDELRRKLKLAHRYMLDDTMSAFLADLSLAAFPRKRDQSIPYSILADGTRLLSASHRSDVLITQMRIAARAPFPLLWVEYNQASYRQRADALLRLPSENQRIHPQRTGWLIEQRGLLHRLHLIAQAGPSDLVCWPQTLLWTVGEVPLTTLSTTRPPPDPTLPASTHSGLGWDEYSKDPLIEGAAGALQIEGRSAWALFAALDEAPVLIKEVRAARGFMAPHEGYRRFLDHKTIVLHVPKTEDMHVLARHVIAHARRCEHNVSGHWRRDWHFWPLARCVHDWQPIGTDCHECGRCRGRRFWVKAHKRGDPSLGRVDHDYEVTHP
jgi:hypothetical protein